VHSVQELKIENEELKRNPSSNPPSYISNAVYSNIIGEGKPREYYLKAFETRVKPFKQEWKVLISWHRSPGHVDVMAW